MKRNQPHWTRHEHLFRGDEYECSACGFRAKKPYLECPNCEAVMNGKGKYDPAYIDELEMADIVFGDD